jgi:regulation of enolase protein 1 (concanavalin A-like superfamily)
MEFLWVNEPPEWRLRDDGLELVTAAGSDFWQRTFYGFQRDSGHARLTAVSGDFTAAVVIRANYLALYDQAGLMLRVDEEHWIKAGIEFTDGLMHFSVVVTSGVSDWSVIPLHQASSDTAVHVRLTRHDNAVHVQFHLGDGHWQMARLCPFPSDDAMVGMTACSPERAGFEARFEGFSLGPAIDRKLHAD